ncbi:GAF domain-like protein [Apiospora kogelbergensis]|uniref:GAF domain-like protein n=1 Tax=Apiospora kogelbergensis TaxID=1337665 RepID=UPI00312D7FD3
MVHADASNFAQGVTKQQAYDQVLLQAEGLFDGQRNWVSFVLGYISNFHRVHDCLLLETDAEDKVNPSPLDIGLASNLSNAASLLWHAYKSLPEPSTHVNWAGTVPLQLHGFSSLTFLTRWPFVAGFYTLDVTASPAKPRLILGPFQGKVACQTIYFGRGVCGAAASSRTTQLVRDVDQFPGHIACDGDSKSEIVVPIVVDDKVVAIIDIDCAVLDGFDEIDQAALENLAALLAKGCDWS